MTNACNETSLPTILSRYSLRDIYNGDEFSLFYQGLPKKVLHMKGEKCSSSKHSKVRLTGMAAASAAGEKLLIFVIDKSAKPRCFKHVKSLPCYYRSQLKNWMNSLLFDEWLQKLETQPMEQGVIRSLKGSSKQWTWKKRFPKHQF